MNSITNSHKHENGKNEGKGEKAVEAQDGKRGSENNIDKKYTIK